MLRRSRKLFIIVLFLGLLLSSLSACSRKDLSSGYSYTKKYKNKALRFGHIKRLGFTFEFDSNARLMIDVLSDEASKNLEDDAFEFYLNPIELNYGEEANLRLNKPATLNIKVPKEYYGTEFDASEMFFANYYDGNWEYYLPEYFDLTDKVATIDVSHFSFWGFGKPNEETQIDLFAKTIANEMWLRQNNKDKLYTNLSRQYEDLFASMGIIDKTMKTELAHNMIEYLEGKIYQDNSVASEISSMTKLISLVRGVNQGEEIEAFTSIIRDITAQGLLEFIKLEPSYFLNLSSIASGLSSSTEAIIEDDTERALEGIREALHSDLMLKVRDDLINYAKSSGEYAIEIFTASELEKAYKAYIGEGSGKYGYHSGLESDFNAIFTLLSGGQRQMEINIINKYMDKYNIDDLSSERKKQIIDNAYKYLEKSFEERKLKTVEIEKTKEKEKDFIKLMKDAYFLREFFHRDYFGMNTRNAKFDIHDRLRRLYVVRETVLNLIDPKKVSIISDEELIILIEQYIKFKEMNELDSFYEELRNTGYLKQISKLNP